MSINIKIPFSYLLYMAMPKCPNCNTIFRVIFSQEIFIDELLYKAIPCICHRCGAKIMLEITDYREVDISENKP